MQEVRITPIGDGEAAVIEVTRGYAQRNDAGEWELAWEMFSPCWVSRFFARDLAFKLLAWADREDA